MPIPKKTINFIKNKNLKIYIETGFKDGDSVSNALECDFNKIFSIEIHKEYLDKNKYKFKDEIKSGKVILVNGDSSEKLGDIIQNINEPIVFFLDAHAHERGDEINSPLIKELNSIKNHPIKNHIIVIDDYNEIEGNNGNNGKKWYNVISDKEIKNIINEIYDNKCKYSKIYYNWGSRENYNLICERSLSI